MNIERTRAWRRFKNQAYRNKGMGSNELWKPIKNWKYLGTRSQKVLRARRLGFEYPKKKIDLEVEADE